TSHPIIQLTSEPPERCRPAGRFHPSGCRAVPFLSLYGSMEATIGPTLRSGGAARRGTTLALIQGEPTPDAPPRLPVAEPWTVQERRDSDLTARVTLHRRLGGSVRLIV